MGGESAEGGRQRKFHSRDVFEGTRGVPVRAQLGSLTMAAGRGQSRARSSSSSPRGREAKSSNKYDAEENEIRGNQSPTRNKSEGQF